MAKLKDKLGNEYDLSFKSFSFVAGDSEDSAKEESVLEEQSYNHPMFAARMLEMKRTLNKYKADVVAKEMFTDLDKFMQDTVILLQTRENKKTHQLNHPVSVLSWFKPHNKIQPDNMPQKNAKPLPAEQAAEFILAKQILDEVHDYISNQKNLSRVVNAVKNVTRDPSMQAQPTGDVRDNTISLWLSVRDLKKGAFTFLDSNENPARIKDHEIIRILSDTATALTGFASVIERNMQAAVKRVKQVTEKHVDVAFADYLKDNPDASHIKNLEDKINILAADAPKNKFEELLSEIHKDLMSRKPQFAPEDSAITPRRNNWM